MEYEWVFRKVVLTISLLVILLIENAKQATNTFFSHKMDEIPERMKSVYCLYISYNISNVIF